MHDYSNLDFARLALEKGFCSQVQIQASLRELNELDAGGQQIQLGQILVRRRVLTARQFAEIVESLDQSILRCTGCRTTHHVHEFEETEVYRCKRCGSELRPHSRMEDAVIDTRLGSTPPPAGPPRGSDSQTILYAESDGQPPRRQKIGDYRILEQVGRGGMGVVYRAILESTGQEVALKVLLGAEGIDDERVQRFQREGRIVSQLEHPNIVRTHDFGRDGELHYFAMDFIDGTTLDERLGKQPLPQRKALQLIETIARAAHHAHQQGVIHRDLKPGNILVDADGVPRIMDFGLARVMGDDDHSLTRTGQPMGTPYYMSPEQCRGEKRRINHRSDVYALGAMLYELLAGRRPFAGRSTIDLYHKIQNEDPPALRSQNPAIPKVVEDICFRALAKDPEERYPSAEVFADDIAAFLSGGRIDSGTRTGAHRRRLRRKTWPIVVGAGAVAAIAMVLVLVMALIGNDGPPGPDARPAWQDDQAALEQAVRTARFDEAAARLESMAGAGAPTVELARSRELARDKLSLRYTELVQLDELAEAAALLRLAARFDMAADTIGNLRQLALDKSFERARRHLEQGEFRKAESFLAAVREAFGEDRRLVEFERWAAGLCTLRFTGRPAGGRVRLQQLVAETDEPRGEPIELGPIPTEGAVKFGTYRVTVEREETLLTFTVLLVRGPGGRPMTAEYDLVWERIDEGMVLVPAGPFLFGPPTAERSIELGALLVDRTEVTGAEYGRYLADLASPVERRERLPFYSVDDPSGRWSSIEPPPGSAGRPVAHLTYEDMLAYALWAGKRLPSEEEWEKAARGPDGRPFPWGRVFEPSRAILDRPGTEPVGSLAMVSPSPYGAVDQCGNVRETTATSGPKGTRVVKGGSYDTTAARSRTFDRQTVEENKVSADVGFRCVRNYLPWTEAEELRAALSDTHPGIRQEAARLLARFEPDPETAGALRRVALGEPDDLVRRTAVRALATHLDPPGTDAILEAAARRTGDARRWALEAAAALTPAERLDEVVDHLVDRDEDVRLTVRRGLLARHEPAARAPLEAVFDPASESDVHDGIAFLLADLGDPAGLDHLHRRVAPEVPASDRLAAAMLLRQLADPAAILPLIRLHGEVGETFAFQFLVPYVREGTALGPLRAGLGHPEAFVRLTCSTLLGDLGDEASLDALFDLASRDESPEVRRAARSALDRIR